MTGFAFAYAVVRVCGGQPRKNPGAPHPQYNKYLDSDMFRTFKIVEGNIVWGDDWDLIFPMEKLYRGKAENNGTA